MWQKTLEGGEMCCVDSSGTFASLDFFPYKWQLLKPFFHLSIDFLL